MSDIEKEFFEAMEIKPTMLCQCSFKNLKDYRYEYEYGDDNCEHSDDFEFSCKDCEKSIQNIPLYPPITSDIVLGLEEIILDKHKARYSVSFSYNWNYNGRYYTCSYSANQCYCPYDSKFKTSNPFNNKKDALLSLCVQLKDEISEEVKALFKC